MTTRRPAWRLWSAIGVVLIALNLRPAVIAPSPLMGDISDAVGLSALGAGALITLPVLCFGVLGPLAPVVAHRWGMERTLAGVLVAICLGSALRLQPSAPALFAGTFLIGAGIAIGNVVMPGLIKRDFSDRVGLMSGLYTMSLAGGATLAAGITLPVARAAGLDWNAALAAWGLFALLALLVWLPQLRSASGGGGLVRPAAINLIRDPIAWVVTIFFGVQSFSFYAINAWLPSLLVAHGYDPIAGGLMLSLTNLVSIIPALVVPMLLDRLHSQAGFAVALTLLYLVATVGLLVNLDLAMLWVIILGIAQGSTLGLSMTLIVLRSPDVAHATSLSGMAQGWGYVFAAIAPLLLGAVHDVTLTWTAPLVLLLVLLLPQGITGYLAGLPRMVGRLDRLHDSAVGSDDQEGN